MKLKDPRDTLAAMTARSIPCESFVASWNKPDWIIKAQQRFEAGIALDRIAANQATADKAPEAQNGE